MYPSYEIRSVNTGTLLGSFWIVQSRGSGRIDGTCAPRLQVCIFLWQPLACFHPIRWQTSQS